MDCSVYKEHKHIVAYGTECFKNMIQSVLHMGQSVSKNKVALS